MLRNVTAPCDPARPQPTAKLRASQYRAPAAVRRERDGSANVQLTYCYRDRRRYSPGCRFFSPPRLVGRGAKRTYFAVEEWGEQPNSMAESAEVLACGGLRRRMPT